MKMEKMNPTKPADKKAPPRPAQSFEAAALDFEASKIVSLQLSRKIAWRVCAGLIGITVLSLLALLVALFNHKDAEPLVIKQNTVTGEMSMLRSVKDAQDKYDEVTDKYWIGTYIKLRENYDWYTIGTESEMVKLMSAPDVGTQYMNTIQAPNSSLNVLKDKAKVIVKISSITFVGDLAQVRFTTQRLNTSGENMDGSPEQSWIATLSYKFESGMMTDQQRLVNPAGFKIMTYRVDAEVLK